MSVSDIAIANRALDLAGLDPIVSLGDDGTSAALIARNLELTRDATLRAYPWNCAMRRAALAADTAAPAWGPARRFALPEGPPTAEQPYALRVWSIEGERDFGVKYRVEGRFILTDESAPLNISYIGRVDWGVLDALCADAIAARLAIVVAANRTRSPSIVAELREYYRDLLAEARRADAQEGSPEEQGPEFPGVPGWLESRA